MAKIQIKSEKLAPFGGIFSIMDTDLSFKKMLLTQKYSYFIASVSCVMRGGTPTVIIHEAI